MKHDLPGLDSLKVFEAAARNLSFAQAADELCITRGAVSYQIRKLESELGVSLFKRQVRQVLLTDAGQKLLQTTQRIFSELSRGIDRLAPPDQRQVTIAVTTYVASRWLSPLVTEFCIDHPEVSLQFQHTVNSTGFRLSDVDVAIQWGRCGERLDAMRLKEIPMALYPACTPAIAKAIDEKGSIDRYAGIPLLCENRSQDLWEEWAGDNYDLSACPRRVIDDANVRVQAAIDGQGMVLADDMMATEFRNDSLAIAPGPRLEGYGYVIMRNPRADHGTVDSLLGWLLDN